MEDLITIDELARVDLRAGKVLAASAPEWSKKLIKQEVDFGEEIGKKIIFSGLRKWYEPEDFVGKTLVYVVNLPARKMGEEESQGMILAVEDSKGVPRRWELPESVLAGTRVS
ncbi:methionine--tRNA ligase [Microgenomates group bacterium]|nr:methionine--tRNA ligase [Microgenomates group bacterium]